MHVGEGASFLFSILFTCDCRKKVSAWHRGVVVAAIVPLWSALLSLIRREAPLPRIVWHSTLNPYSKPEAVSSL